MLRIYITTALVALVQFNALATIRAAPVPVAFGSLVLTVRGKRR
jgi:paraquat-inducible protein A